MPGKNQTYGKDFKSFSLLLSPDEHRAAKIKAAEHGVSLAEVLRLALADDALWKRAAKARATAEKARTAE